MMEIEAYAPLFFAFGLGGSLAGLIIIGLRAWRDRIRCVWCGRRHPKRHEGMSTEEFLRFYCDGWKTRRKQGDAK